MTASTSKGPGHNLIHPEMAQAIAKVFSTHDRGLALGPFTRVTPTKVVRWIKSKGVIVTCSGNRPVAAAAMRVAKSRQPVKDFTGQIRAIIQPGDTVVNRIACLPGYDNQLLAILRRVRNANRSTWLSVWQEHPTDRMIVRKLRARWLTSKVRASSELIGVWVVGPKSEIQKLPLVECVTLCRLKLLTLRLSERIKSGLGRRLRFVDHYSIYNKRRGWSALALRGYGGKSTFIVKPSEMSKKWMRQNPEKLLLELKDTPTRRRLGKLEPLVEAVPGRKQRIRLMRLAPGATIGRHSDIVDKETGTLPGKFLRIHIPLKTNPGVKFTSWDLHGREIQERMRIGEFWYLDTRKPHKVENRGETERVHLVMDVEACPELIHLLSENR